ncbi:MAG: type II CRISPR RNA-guided endonuclease Cas9, partial [Pyrinomonadaceae bacterium]|nr:type II CRISPR RNA-guided endonuclease Cas9 [Pyrinomonadaceae bacterium]
MTTTQTILGLDLGVTSIGWSLLKLEFGNEAIESAKICASGVRIFPATTEGTQSTPKNFGRRTARGTRRLLRRKRERKEKLLELLFSNNLLPEINKIKSSEIFDSLGNPYLLRDKGLAKKLDPFEIGRAIYHLAKRRGFLSNRKSGKSKEDGVVYSGIAKVSEEIEKNNFQTLGQYLNSQDKKRGFYTARQMTENEFELLWSAQSKFYPEILSDNLKTELKHTIFYQRPIQSQRGLIGKCSFEKNKKRCDMARQEAQRLRYWQDINNLLIREDNSFEWRKLTEQEKVKLANEFEKKKELTYKGLRKLLKLREIDQINLEANEKKLYGNKTAVIFRKAIGNAWDTLSGEKQNLLTEDFFRIESELSLVNRLKDFWKFSNEQIENLLKVELESGYSRISLKAIRKVLPLMMQGKRYDEAITEIYGDHRKQFDMQSFEKLALPPKDLRNPIVSKALHELRKVINAILREYGKPDEIHLEMARDLKLTAIQKERVQKQQNQNKKANDEAAEFYKKKFGLENISGTDKIKYRLWKEAGEMCPYTGEAIPPETLLDDQFVDIEHIIPYSRCFDDSYMNKTICLAKFNRDIKKNQTPFEIFGSNEQKYFELLQRIENLPFGKRKKFETKEVKFDEMVGRQLSDTRYICREARAYLLQLYDNEQSVMVVSGGATANLRHVWGLNSILSDGDVDEKNRNDHRHHAIDAIVIALMNRSLFQYISRIAGRNRDLMRRKLSGFEMPWKNFLSDVDDSINSLTVSHSPVRRVRGKLMESTALGATNQSGIFVKRKFLTELTSSGVKKIVDKTVKEIVIQRISEFNGDLKKAFAEPLFHKDGKTLIKKVRIHESISPDGVVPIYDESGKPYKFYELGSNHHAEIFENLLTEERRVRIISRFEATKHIRESVKKRNVSSPLSRKPDESWGNLENWRFLFSLCKNDYVGIVGDYDGLKVYRVQKMSVGFEITLRDLSDTKTDTKEGTPLRLRSN